MNRARIAFWLTAGGWLSGLGAFAFSSAPSAIESALFFGPAAGCLLHCAAVVVAGLAVLRPPPGSTTRRPAVTALLGLAALAAAFVFASVWVANNLYH